MKFTKLHWAYYLSGWLASANICRIFISDKNFDVNSYKLLRLNRNSTRGLTLALLYRFYLGIRIMSILHLHRFEFILIQLFSMDAKRQGRDNQ